MAEIAIEMRDISKSFPGILANDRVTLTVESGTAHALLGENGAGKTTLMKILSGLYRADSGTIAIHGRQVWFRSPRDAIAVGIGMVHQHFRLVETMTVAENLTVGMKSPRLLLRRRQLNAVVDGLVERYGLHVRSSDRIWELSVGEQQRVEILKQLYRGAGILILDEPTAVLTPQEGEDLFSVVRQMTADGRTVIFITHKMREVHALADQITVLLGGRNVGTVGRAATDRDLVRMMVGRELRAPAARVRRKGGEPVLALREVHASGNRTGGGLRGVSLELRSGEILGVAGVAGNGQSELAEVIAGLRSIQHGEIKVDAYPVRRWDILRACKAGICFIPEDRHGTATCATLSVRDNLMLRQYRSAPLSRGPLLRHRVARKHAESLVREFDIRTPSLATRSRVLSGGNLQRLILARELSTKPRVIVAHHPTFGLDVAATETVHDLLTSRAEAGAAVLLISEDLDEVLELSDRIAVLYEGKITDVLGPDSDREEIGVLMSGHALAST